MLNYYEILGLNTSATDSEIRRAYRILARRYHPDLNPDKHESEKFKLIAQAYDTLNNAEKRKQYDIDLDNFLQQSFQEKINAYKKRQEASDKAANTRARERYFKAQQADIEAMKHLHEMKNKAQQKGDEITNKVKKLGQPVLSNVVSKLRNIRKGKSNTPKQQLPVPFQIIEISVSVPEAIFGVRKAVELSDGNRKINVKIPAGVYPGTILKLRSDNRNLVAIIRVARHPFISMHSKGIVVEMPVTIAEAIQGATIKVPTLEEAILLKVPPGTQSGTELRIRGKGVRNNESRGDLFARIMIQVPSDTERPGLKDKAELFKADYDQGVRKSMPDNLGNLIE
ncbi:MAG: DnaJ domain-containing protein [Bdellovibrionales bacterium]|nr:DnaJ domain-containing protein [Bdellovibrionales bacterium]